VIVALSLFTIITLVNFQFSKTNPGGTDFLVHWMGTRNFIQTGTSPYSDDTALKIQTMVYGRAAQTGEHELRVAYPLYSILFFAPFALISNFNLARALWMTLLEICLVGIVIVSFRMTYWKPKPILFGLFVLFSLVSYNGVRPLINGNAVIVVTFLVLVSLLLMRDGKDEIAGIILAFSTIKPQNVVLLVLFLLFWALINRRFRFIGYFLGTMLVLIGISTLLIPDWFVQNLREVIRYPSYNPPGTVGAVLTSWWGDVGSRFSYAVTGVLTVLLGLEWWLGRKSKGNYFLWVAYLTIVVSQWIGIQTDPGNFILLYPALFFAIQVISKRWKRSSPTLIIGLLSIITLGIWILFLMTLQKSYQPIQNSILFFPLPLIVFILLYWIRWWVVNSKHIDFSEKLFEI
jgi:hypothetical protein